MCADAAVNENSALCISCELDFYGLIKVCTWPVDKSNQPLAVLTVCLQHACGITAPHQVSPLQGRVSCYCLVEYFKVTSCFIIHQVPRTTYTLSIFVICIV